MDSLKTRFLLQNKWSVIDATLISTSPKANHSLKSGKKVRVKGRERSVAMELSGLDSNGKQFKNAEEMWREQIGEEGEPHKKTQWYHEGVSYWEVSCFHFFF